MERCSQLRSLRPFLPPSSSLSSGWVPVGVQVGLILSSDTEQELILLGTEKQCSFAVLTDFLLLEKESWLPYCLILAPEMTCPCSREYFSS